MIDNDTNHSISGATVYLQLRGDRRLREDVPLQDLQKLLRDERRLVTTNGEGQAEVAGIFGAGGTRTFLRSTAHFSADARLHISHPEYSTTVGLLQSYLGSKTLPLNTRNLEVTIYLTRPNDSL